MCYFDVTFPRYVISPNWRKIYDTYFAEGLQQFN